MTEKTLEPIGAQLAEYYTLTDREIDCLNQVEGAVLWAVWLKWVESDVGFEVIGVPIVVEGFLFLGLFDPGWADVKEETLAIEDAYVDIDKQPSEALLVRVRYSEDGTSWLTYVQPVTS